MISYDLDPSLYTGKPEPQLLDDGFSPPPSADPDAARNSSPDSDDGAYWTKSTF